MQGSQGVGEVKINYEGKGCGIALAVHRVGWSIFRLRLLSFVTFDFSHPCIFVEFEDQGWVRQQAPIAVWRYPLMTFN